MRGLRQAVVSRRAALVAAQKVGLAAAAFVAAALWRLLTYTGFPNDHYVHLARAQQLLLGAWPVRDFVDPGMPLMYGVSALSRWLFGTTHWSEFLVVTGGFALGAAATALVGLRLTSLVSASAAVVLLQILVSPRSYSYPKVLLYAVAACGIVMAASQPTRRRIVLLGVIVAIAFLFRHDHGLYIGVGGAVMLLARLPPDWRATARGLLLYAATVVLLLAPWAFYVQVFEGLREYVASGLEFSLRESDATSLRAYPQFDFAGPFLSRENSEAWMLGVVVGVPVLCLVLALVRGVTRRETWTGESAAIAGLSVLALLADRGFIRDPIGMRLADASILPCLLGGWAMALACRRPVRVSVPRVAAASLAVVLLAISTATLWRIADVTENIDRTGFFNDADAMASNVHEVIADLGAYERTAQQSPSRFVAALAPFFDYVESCTSPSDRLLITGQHPDVFLAARRGFAGGHIAFMQGFYVAPAEQALTLERLRRESVPFVLLAIDRQQMFEHDFPVIAGYLAREYAPLFDLDVPETNGVRVMVPRQRAPVRPYAQVGWPCYR
jgi:hypothetical protein